MATSNRIRALNRLPFDFQDGLKVAGVDVTALNQIATANGAGLVGVTPVGGVLSTNVQAALAELDSKKIAFTRLDDTDGSGLVGYDGGTVQDVMDSAKPMADYTALRAYTGRATSVRITSNGIAGFFYRDDTDTSSVDNGGTVIVAGNGKRWKRIKGPQTFVSWFGFDQAAFTLAINSIGSAQKELVVDTNISLSVNVTVPQNITLHIERGYVVSLNIGIVLEVLGRIEAGNYVIFSGPGTLDLNSGSAFFNVCWFEGAYLNNKWDFISRGLVALRPFTVVIPKPERGMQGTIELSQNLIYWAINAPIVFPNKANACQWISDPDSRIIATVPIDAMIEFSTDSKVEDVTFSTGLWLEGDSKATYGVKFHGGSRIRSNGMMQISGCSYNLYFDNIGGSNDKINLNSLYLARWNQAAIWIEGSGNAMVACYFPEIIMEQPASDLKNCIVVRGQTRGVRFGRTHYIHYLDAKVAETIFLIQSTINGYSSGLSIEEIYTSSPVNTLVKIENSGGSQRAVYSTIGKLVGLPSSVPVSLNYDIYTTFKDYSGFDVVYGVNSQEPSVGTNLITRVFDFSKSGGAIGTYNLGGSIPKGATGIRAWYKVVTEFTSSGSATLRLGITGSLAGIKGITAFSDLVWGVGLHDGIPDGTAANALPEVVNPDTFISFVIANAAINSGKIIVYLQIIK